MKQPVDFSTGCFVEKCLTIIYSLLLSQLKFFMKFIIKFIFLLLSLSTLAQQNNLDPVTVSAALTKQNQSQTGRNIIVLDNSILQKQPIYSIDDLLKHIPGIEVHQRGLFGSQADISIRGSTYQQILVVIDGLRLNDPLTGHFNGYIPIHVSEIDRIEVLYGGSSAIYGTEAVGGVIHIFTKSYNALQKPQKNQLQATSTIGEFGLISNSVGGLINTNKSTISGGINILNTWGQPQRGTNSFANNFNSSIAFSSKINQYFNVLIRGALDSRNFSAQNFYTNFKSDTATEKVNTLWTQFQLQYKKGKSNLIFDMGYKSVSDSFRFNKTSSANINESSLFQTQLQFNYELNNNNKLIVGCQFIQKNILSNDRGNHNIPQGALFIIWQNKIGNNFFITPSVRYDNSKAFGSNVVAQLNTSYTFKKATVRFSIGNTIRDADFTERFNNYGKALVTSGTIGNPNLEAEKAINYELGSDFYISKNLKIAATVFQRQQTNLIDFAPTPYANMPRKDNLVPTGIYSLASNISSITTTGLELNFLYNKKWQKSQLNAIIGILWLDNSNADELANKSFYIQSTAKLIYSFTLDYSYDKMSIAINGLYKIRNQMQTSTASFIAQQIQPENYFITNLRCTYSLPKLKLKAFVQINNFYDIKYSDLLGSIMPRRWVSGGVNFNL